MLEIAPICCHIFWRSQVWQKKYCLTAPNWVPLQRRSETDVPLIVSYIPFTRYKFKAPDWNSFEACITCDNDNTGNFCHKITSFILPKALKKLSFEWTKHLWRGHIDTWNRMKQPLKNEHRIKVIYVS